MASDEKKLDSTNLDDLIGGNVKKHAPVTIDVTKGVTPEDQVPTNIVEGKTESVPVESVTTKKEVKAAVDAGPMDKDNLQTINPYDILEHKKQDSNEEDGSVWGDLDKAVEREKESITKRIEAVRDMQKKEIEAMEEAKEEEELRKAEANDLVDNVDTASNEEDGADYGDDDDDDIDIENVFNSNTSVKEEEATLDDVVDEEAYNIYKEKPREVIPEETHAVDVKTVKIEEEPKQLKKEEEDEKKVNILDMVDDESLFEDEEEEDSANIDQEEAYEELKAEIKTKIKPIRNKIDLSKFTIAQKSVNAQKVMKLAVKSHQNVADWVLYSGKRPISMTGLSGPEIIKLNPQNTGRNRLNTFRDMYRVLYDHLYDGNKPEFETWMRQTRWIDLKHVYFCVYKATFSGSNFITYSCECGNNFIKDIPFEDMVRYADDKVKEEVKAILKGDTTSASSDEYPVDLYQISSSYVFGLKSPSIWNVIIETATLSDTFLEQHADLIDLVSYIDSIYLIDSEKNTLIPVDTKPDPNNQARTSARRIRAFYDIIKTLSSEDFYALRAQISEYDKDDDKVSYFIPAATCPKCAREIAENDDITPDQLLFMRHQLAAIGNL